MKRGHLSDYFSGVGSKLLAPVDTLKSTSTQHEVGDGDRGEVLKRALGNEPRKKNNRFRAQYLWMLDEQETISDEGYCSWYDTREKQEHRAPEWRLYYQTNPVTELMNEGDRLFVARKHDDTLLFIVVPDGSVIARKLLWLFDLSDTSLIDFQEVTPENDTKLDFAARFILDSIGVEFEDPDANSLDTIIDRFGNRFPSTAEFSNLARLTLPEVDAADDPDSALLAWLDHEEAMFRRLEARIISRDLEAGWTKDGKTDVDAFIKYSLGVQNRRKSRMGRSLENHLAAVFDAHGIRYDSQVITENKKKPDFIFPGKTEYFDSTFSTNLLTMLAAKSTCKDRWSQILPEAARLTERHLVTLEPGISEPQTKTMQAEGVQLIVPGNIRTSYTTAQQSWLWSIEDFVKLVSGRQNRTN